MKVFVITDANGKILCEQTAEFAHVALKAAKDEHSNAKTAIVKEEWQRERRERAWLMKARVEE